jgi:hypothetical protein
MWLPVPWSRTRHRRCAWGCFCRRCRAWAMPRGQRWRRSPPDPPADNAAQTAPGGSWPCTTAAANSVPSPTPPPSAPSPSASGPAESPRQAWTACRTLNAVAGHCSATTPSTATSSPWPPLNLPCRRPCGPTLPRRQRWVNATGASRPPGSPAPWPDARSCITESSRAQTTATRWFRPGLNAATDRFGRSLPPGRAPVLDHEPAHQTINHDAKAPRSLYSTIDLQAPPVENARQFASHPPKPRRIRYHSRVAVAPPSPRLLRRCHGAQPIASRRRLREFRTRTTGSHRAIQHVPSPRRAVSGPGTACSRRSGLRC